MLSWLGFFFFFFWQQGAPPSWFLSWEGEGPGMPGMLFLLWEPFLTWSPALPFPLTGAWAS